MQRYRQGGVARSPAPEKGMRATLPGGPDPSIRPLESGAHRRVAERGVSGRADLSTSPRAFLGAVDWSRLLDVVVAAVGLIVLSPVIALVALAVKFDSRGPVFVRCSRVGQGGRAFPMLKFRKMRDGVSGSLLTAARDDRFTRIGRLLAETKVDEVPQLWNVVRGWMRLVGPRPEDPEFVRLHREQYEEILRVRPGITGLSQLAFASEAKILAVDDRLNDYVERILPQKMQLDRLYVESRSLKMDLQILVWTVARVGLGKDAAVHRGTGRLTLRRPRDPRVANALDESPALADSSPGA